MMRFTPMRSHAEDSRRIRASMYAPEHLFTQHEPSMQAAGVTNLARFKETSKRYVL